MHIFILLHNCAHWVGNILLLLNIAYELTFAMSGTKTACIQILMQVHPCCGVLEIFIRFQLFTKQAEHEQV